MDDTTDYGFADVMNNDPSGYGLQSSTGANDPNSLSNLLGGLGSLGTAAGKIISSVKGTTTNQAALSAANMKTMLIVGAAAAGLLVLVMAFRK